MFVDDIKVKLKAGSGGNGLISFRREKYIDKGGPSGGDGGNGGHIYFVGTKSLTTLNKFKKRRIIKAESGKGGGKQNKTGKSGQNIFVDVPLGTIFKNENGEFLGEIIKEEEKILLAKGGRGGKGNARFANSRNQAPRIAQNGEDGEEKEIDVELKLLADAGIIGFPSVGKSTLLSVLTNAKPKTGSYDFTTLTPNLGVVSILPQYDFVIADLPGLIEGASKGKGLGIEFLKHVERCRVLIHVLDVSKNANNKPLSAYKTVIEELKQYDLKLEQRPQIVILNKIDDLMDKEELKKVESFFKNKNITYFKTSSFTREGLKPLVKETFNLIQKTPKFALNTEKIKTYTLEKDNNNDFVVRKEDNYFIVEGKAIDRIIKRVNFTYDEGFKKFISILNSIGVEKELRKKGIKQGDEVFVGNKQFTYFGEES